MGMLKAGIVTLFTIAVATVVMMAVIPPTTDGQAAGGTTSPTGSSGGDATSGEVVMRDIKYAPLTLRVATGATITWTNEDPMGHTVTPTDKAAWGSEGSGDAPAAWLQQGDTWSFTFTKPGTYQYFCLPHASKRSDGSYAGMVGTVIVGASGAAAAEPAFVMPDASVVPDPVAPPRALPGADGIVRLSLTTKEVTARLADGVAYTYWTFDGTVPGPMLRVREGDTVELTLANGDDSTMAHSIDLHAVTGPGGGAKVTQTQPGNSTAFRFLAKNPGLFVYHCATPHIPSHVANGMFGLILVEPLAGLPPVDREYFVVESEVYTVGGRGAPGLQSLSIEKLQQERPDYFVLNGAVGAITGAGQLTANVGESVRIYFGVGGGVPSSFHVIGEVFDTVWMDGNEAATHNRQTVLVPAAGAAIFDFVVDYPGDYILVDHTLTRTLDAGAAGILHVSGEADPAVFQGVETAGSGH